MSPSPIPAELEAKLLAPGESTLRAVARLAEIGAYRVTLRDTVRLHSLYLDTAELALTRQGIALRLRRCGRRWEATVKWEGRSEREIHERPELTVPLRGRPRIPFELNQPELFEHLAARVAGRPLRTVLVTDIRRTRLNVTTADSASEAAPLVEIALDRVYLHGTEPDEPETRYYEIEIERLGGQRKDVVQIAAFLRNRFGLYPSTESKFARGIALLHHPQWLGVPPVGLVAEDSVVSGARKVVAVQLEELRVHDPGTRRGDDAEAVHDMRVATRRLRAALSMFSTAFPPRLRTTLRDELKWLRGCLGGVRDIDVQLQRVVAFCASTPAGLRAAVESYSRYLERRRTEYRKIMSEALRSPRYFALLERLEKFSIGAMPVSDDAALRPVGGLAAEVVAAAYQRVRKRGRKVQAEPTPEDLHELRIRAKRLRYALEFCRDLAGRDARRAVRRLVRLQDLLGAFHDAVVAADFVRQYVETGGRRAGSAALITMGAFLGQELHRADDKRRDFGRVWKRFEGRRTRREFEAIIRRLGHDSSIEEADEPPAAAPKIIAVEAPAPDLRVSGGDETSPTPVKVLLSDVSADGPGRMPAKRSPARPDDDGTIARAAGEEER
jgi:inorganic triphosphatase YgiF